MEIKLSKYEFNGNINIIENEYIVVDSIFEKPEPSYLKFRNCTFQFTILGRLIFNRVDIEDCIFQGIVDLKTYSSVGEQLQIINCDVNKIKLTYQFAGILILNSRVTKLTDNSTTESFTINSSNLTDFRISGSTQKFHSLETVFQSENDKSSTFNKKIISEATCKRVTYDNVNVNPFYLSTKCYDKSTLDLSRATLIDDWSKLRKSYAGLSLFIIFLLTFLFFLPILTHSFFLLVLTKLDTTIIDFKRVPLWEALLYGGKEGWQAIGYACLTFILLNYNIGRLYLTIKVAKLREEEKFLKDANFVLVSIHPDKIEKLLKIDRILSVLFWISIGYSFLKLIDTLFISVPIFN